MSDRYYFWSQQFLFTAIEHVWSVAKHNFDKLLLINTVDLNQRTFEDLV